MSKKKMGIQATKKGKSKVSGQWRRFGLTLPAAGSLVFAAAPAAHAFQLYDGTQVGNNLEISLSITTSYSAFERVHSPSAFLTSGTNNANGNDGDSNLQHGLVGNIFEALPVLDIKDNDFGMHFSGEYFINTVYLGTNQNDQNATVNPFVSKPNDYASQTRKADGMNGRLLDAFLYNTWNLPGNQSITFKAGQQTLLWGQSLFFGTNGIAGGQAPIDVISAENLVNPQTQQVFLPVGQLVFTYKPSDTYTLQGYYQYQWVPYSLQGVGSYFSTSDVTGPGGQRILVPTLGGYASVLNTKALTPESQNGQFGLSVQAQFGNYDDGLFVERYDSKTPDVDTVVNLKPSGLPPAFGIPFLPAGGTYRLIYARDIWLYGASASTTIGATNVAGEVSLRTHDPLVTAGPSAITIDGQGSTYEGNANSNPFLPIGNVVAALGSFIYGSPALSFDPGGITTEGEVEYVSLTRVTAMKALLAPGRTNGAAALDLQVSPAYFEVIPDLELQFPVSVKYNFAGSSRVDASMNNGTGTWSAGVSATYRATWDASLSYVGYFGRISPDGLAASVSTNADRSYVTLNLQHTF